MKALDEYFLMVVFTLLLNRVHVFAIFMFHLDMAVKTLKRGYQNPRAPLLYICVCVHVFDMLFWDFCDYLCQSFFQ